MGGSVVEALGGFDPKATYDDASHDYEDASRDFWQYLSFRTVERLRLQPGEMVLDVPCGTGPSLIAAAERVGSSGRAVGIDYSDQMLAIARHKIQTSGLHNVEAHIGDMTFIAPPTVPYDAVISVLGIFFVDDMPGLVRSFYELLRPAGGRLGVAVFGERLFDPMRDLFLDAVATVAPGIEVVQPWKRTEDPSVLRRVFEDAGVGEVTVETEDDVLPLPSAADWWRIVMGSGLRRTVKALGDDRAAEVRARCDAYIESRAVVEVVNRVRYCVAVRD